MKQLNKSDNTGQCCYLLTRVHTDISHLSFILSQGVIYFPSILRENLVILTGKERLKERHTQHAHKLLLPQGITNIQGFEFLQKKNPILYLSIRNREGEFHEVLEDGFLQSIIWLFMYKTQVSDILGKQKLGSG